MRQVASMITLQPLPAYLRWKGLSGMAIFEMLKRTARPVVYLGLLSASAWSFAADAAPQATVPPAAVPQITQSVSNQQRITLKGNVRPMPKRARDLGAVNINSPASRVLLLLKRPALQEV